MRSDGTPADPETALAIAYSSAVARPAFAALLELDARLRKVVADASEPMLALIRLVWWRDQLAVLDAAPRPAEPLLAALWAARLPGPAMAAMVDGWEAIVDDPGLGDDTVAAYAAARGAGLFAIAGDVFGARPEDAARLARAGTGWAKIDLVRAGLAHRGGDADRVAAVFASAAEDVGAAGRWPRRLRSLGQLAILARRDVTRGVAAMEPHGARARLLRIAAFHLAGR